MPSVQFLRVASLLALASCALDSAGALPGEGGSTASSGSTTGASGSTTTTTAPSSTSGGQGGEGGSGASGGAGPSSGGGGAGGSAGGGGEGGAPSVEWVKLLAGEEHQTIQDVAMSPDGVSVYVVGIVRELPVTFDGRPLVEPSGDDAFVAKVALDGSEVRWARVFGGPGDDQARSVAARRDTDGAERVYVGGTANGRNQAEMDFFAPGLEIAVNDNFGWLIELSPLTGAPEGGVPWSPVQSEDTVDVAVMPAGNGIAVSTCRSGCVDSVFASALGSDVIFAGNNPASTFWVRRLLPYAGEQHGRAIVAHPTLDAFLVAGELDGVGFDARFPPTPESCFMAGLGDVDAFAAFYAFSNGDFRCAGALALGGPGRDEARAAARDDASGYVSVHSSQAGALGATPGPYVAKVSLTDVLWATLVDGGVADSQVFSVARIDGLASVSGRRGDRGFVQALDPTTGALGPLRLFTGDDASAINTHARSADTWVIGGRYRGNASFGGDLLGQPVPLGGSADGFVARIAPP